MEKLKKISTKDLVDELIKRDGVLLKIVEPHKEKDIHVCGSALVLVVVD